jgi:hypothetical protein
LVDETTNQLAMNRRHLIKSIVCTALGGSLITPNAEASGAKPCKAKHLRVGERLDFDDDLSIRFLSVKKDERCPINAQCVSAGDAEVLLRVKVGTSKSRVVSLHTDDKPNQLVLPVKRPKGMFGIPKSYVVSIDSLDPLPYAGKKTPQGDYRLRLEISVAV